MIRKKSNFTLLEVMIAIGLFAVLAITCVSLMTTLTGSLAAQQERSEHVV